MMTHTRSGWRWKRLSAICFAAGVTLLLTLFSFSLLAKPTQARQDCDITVGASDETGFIDAINSANANNDLTSICLTNSTYTFTADQPVEDLGGNALPSIWTPITIWGSGAILERQSAEQFRFLLTSDELWLHDITLQGGSRPDVEPMYGDGGAIFSTGPLHLYNVNFYNNTAGEDGGAIYQHTGSLHLYNVNFYDNTAGRNGGAIAATEVLTLDGGTLRNNQVGRAGGAIYFHNGDATITNSTIDSNQAQNGGGIAVDGNTAQLGLDLVLEQTTLIHNQASVSGGGIYSSGGTNVFMRDGSEVLENSARYGGGIYQDMGLMFSGTESLILQKGVRVSGNTAQFDGGGIYVFDGRGVRLGNGVEVSYNTAQEGGGLYVDTTSLSLSEEVEIEYNRAEQGGGAIYAYQPGTITIRRAKIAYNQSGSGGAILFDDPNGVSQPVIFYSCLMGNGTAIVDQQGTFFIRAKDNWWGSPTGPSGYFSGSGDGVRAHGIFSPFFDLPLGNLCGDGPPILELPTFTPSRTPPSAASMTPNPSITPSATYTPSPTPLLPTNTPTVTPACSWLSYIGGELVDNRLQITVSNNTTPFFISGANVIWHKTARYPDMYADHMGLSGQPRFWQGPDYTENTVVNSTILGWGGSDTPYTARQITPYGMTTTWQITFNNGPAVLDDTYSLGDFNGTTLYFSRQWGGTGADCSITLDGLPTSTPPAIPPSATPRPVCSDYNLTFESFEPNGVIHFSTTNQGPMTVYLTGFRLNWAHDPDAGPLDFVTLGGASAFDPAGIKLWDGNDNDPPTAPTAYYGDPGWLVQAALEPGETYDLWFDFDATTAPLDYALGYTAGDFNGSSLTVDYFCDPVHVDPGGPSLTPSVTNTPYATFTPQPSPTITITPPFSLTVLPGCSPVGYQGTVICASE